MGNTLFLVGHRNAEGQVKSEEHTKTLQLAPFSGNYWKVAQQKEWMYNFITGSKWKIGNPIYQAYRIIFTGNPNYSIFIFYLFSP